MTRREHVEHGKWLVEQTGESLFERVFLPQIEARLRERGWTAEWIAKAAALKDAGVPLNSAKCGAWFAVRAAHALPESVLAALFGPDLWEIQIAESEAEERMARQQIGTELGDHDGLALGQSCPICGYTVEG